MLHTKATRQSDNPSHFLGSFFDNFDHADNVGDDYG
ncbi:Hypothetical protein NGAL_HAMBI1146_58440 [Neorhizobium galegae bv. officinalis]|nr:Hypothetical protein NGAL_HAMBI1146_58440 [Neorhizobium galegae bv. officinalis]